MTEPRSAHSVSVAEAMVRLKVIPDYDPGDGPGLCVHTLMGSTALLGAHWKLDAVRAAFERWGVEEAGEMATAMGHGLVVIEEYNGRRVPVFFETCSPESDQKQPESEAPDGS